MLLSNNDVVIIYPDEELNDLVDSYNKEDNLIIYGDPNFKGQTISFKELSIIMNHLTNIDREESRKSYRSPILLSENSLEINMSVPQALKEILDFLRSIDEDLYMYALNLIVGVGKDSLTIHDNLDKKSKKSSGNRGIGPKRDILVVLNEYTDRKAAEQLKHIIGKGKCSTSEAEKLMHEISHSFDKGILRRAKDPENPKAIEEIPQAVQFYLSETTAIFFETIFGQHLASIHPGYRTTINQNNRDRIITNSGSVERTRIAAGLVRIKEEKGYVPGNFLEILAGKSKEKKYRNALLKEKSIYESRKYALSQLFVPTMVKVYNQDPEKGKERIKRYIECVKSNDFEGALASFDMSLIDKDKYNQMLRNYREYIAKYRYSRKEQKTNDER